MIRLSKVAFIHEVPNPASMSLEPGNWLRLFNAPQYVIVYDGDALQITHVESGRAIMYPWANVAGAVLEPELKRELPPASIPVPRPMPLPPPGPLPPPPPVVPGKKRR